MPEFDPADYSVHGLLRRYGEILDELQRRGIVRTYNNPIGDYCEWLVADRLGLRLSESSNTGCDAVGPDGTRYQIKGRWLQSATSPRQLSTIRDLSDKQFDFLIAVLFNKDFTVAEAYRIPHNVIAGFARFVARVNGHNLHLQGNLLAAAGVDDITYRFLPLFASPPSLPLSAQQPQATHLTKATAPDHDDGAILTKEKGEALARINRQHGHTVLTHRNTHFANRSSDGDFWWLEVPLKKFAAGVEAPVHLLLYDGQDDGLHHLQVPAAHFRDNLSHLSVRDDVDKVSLYLSVRSGARFQDERGAGVRFGQFLQS